MKFIFLKNSFVRLWYQNYIVNVISSKILPTFIYTLEILTKRENCKILKSATINLDSELFWDSYSTSIFPFYKLNWTLTLNGFLYFLEQNLVNILFCFYIKLSNLLTLPHLIKHFFTDQSWLTFWEYINLKLPLLRVNSLIFPEDALILYFTRIVVHQSVSLKKYDIWFPLLLLRKLLPLW